MEADYGLGPAPKRDILDRLQFSSHPDAMDAHAEIGRLREALENIEMVGDRNAVDIASFALHGKQPTEPKE